MANYEDIGYIISQHKKIEAKLKNILEGRILINDSMHDLISSAKSLKLIDEDLVTDLHQIKNIRNKVAHDLNTFSETDMDDFNALYEKIIKELDILELRKNKMGDFIDNENLRKTIEKKENKINEMKEKERILRQEIKDINNQLREAKKSYYERSPKLQAAVNTFASIINAFDKK